MDENFPNLKPPRRGRRRALTWEQETEAFRRHVLLGETAASVAGAFQIAASTVGLVCARVREKLEKDWSKE